MSAYSGTPTVNRVYERGDRFGHYIETVKDITISISSQGGTTNTIGAAALGFQTNGITGVRVISFTDGSSQNRAIFAWPVASLTTAAGGNTIALGDPQVVTDADRGEPLDMTGTLRMEVSGYQS